MDKMYGKYLRYELQEGEAYIKKDIDLLKDVDAVIFDCDGVLIDIRDSYDKAISETVAYILQKFTGYPFQNDMITDEVIFLFRKSGGFNNDWDTCYGILMFILWHLTEEFQQIFRTCANVDIKEEPLERIRLIEKDVREKDVGEVLDETAVSELVEQLKAFAEDLDESGVLSVDRNLLNSLQASTKDYYEDLKRLLYYPSKVGGSIIPTVFEEIFCGSSLVKEAYGVEPVFYGGRGLIEKERVIVRPEKLNRLSRVLCKPNLGIASGSRFKPARYVLGKTLNYFNSDALVFLDDIEREEEKILKTTGKTVNLKKPNAFSLLKAAEGLRSSKAVLYVGDSVEDALMAQKASEEDSHFMFAGVYKYSSLRDAMLQSFLEIEADIILPSANEIPLILEELKGRRGMKS